MSYVESVKNKTQNSNLFCCYFELRVYASDSQCCGPWRRPFCHFPLRNPDYVANDVDFQPKHQLQLRNVGFGHASGKKGDLTSPRQIRLMKRQVREMHKLRAAFTGLYTSYCSSMRSCNFPILRPRFLQQNNKRSKLRNTFLL